MIQLLLTTTCTARMTADARGGEPRRGESDGTSSISRASDNRGFPRMPAEASRGEVNQTEPHIVRIPSAVNDNAADIFQQVLEICIQGQFSMLNMNLILLIFFEIWTPFKNLVFCPRNR